MAKGKAKESAQTEEAVNPMTSLMIPDSLKAELEALPKAEREEVLKALAEDLRGNLKDEEPEFPVVKVLHSAAMFEFPDETKVESFEGVIIEILPARAWWEVPNSKERIPPDCSSMDWIHPEGDSPNPQAESCAHCPWNRWGSGIDPQGEPTRGKACRMRKRVFLQLKDHEIPFILSVSPMSLRSLKTYMVKLSDQCIQRNRTMTTFTLALQEEGAQTYSVIGFEYGEQLSLAGYLEARRKREAYIGRMEAVTIESDEFEGEEVETVGGEPEGPGGDAPGADGRSSKPLTFEAGEARSPAGETAEKTAKSAKTKGKEDDMPF